MEEVSPVLKSLKVSDEIHSNILKCGGKMGESFDHVLSLAYR
jgi:hypothetical protein